MPKDSDHKIFGIILAYNCGAFLEHTYRIVPKELFDKVIVIDDGSEDDTMEVAKMIGVDAYTHEHGGYGSNLKFGLKKAVELGADSIVEIHGDGQFTSSIPNAIEEMKTGCDFVLGNRYYKLTQPLKDGMSLIRYFGNMALSALGGTVFGTKPFDLFTGFRAYSKRLVETVSFKNTSDDYFFSFEIIGIARYHGLDVRHVPARSYYNQPHTSISLQKCFWEIFQTPYTCMLFILAKMGIKLGIFADQRRKKD